MSVDIDSTIRTVLNDGLAGQLDYYTEYLDVARFPEPDYQPAVRDFFRRKYASQTFDVVVATTNAMVDFVNAYRDELFPGAAVVCTAGSPRAWTEGDRRGVPGGPEEHDRRRDPAAPGSPARVRGERSVGHRSLLPGSGAGAIPRVRRPAWLHLLVRTGDARPASTGVDIASAHDCLLPLVLRRRTRQQVRRAQGSRPSRGRRERAHLRVDRHARGAWQRRRQCAECRTRGWCPGERGAAGAQGRIARKHPRARDRRPTSPNSTGGSSSAGASAKPDCRQGASSGFDSRLCGISTSSTSSGRRASSCCRQR